MKCNECGFENKDTAKFCSKCGNSLEAKPEPEKSGNSKVIIAALVIVIVILIACICYFVLANDSSNSVAPAQSSSGSEQSSGSSSPSSSSEESSQPSTSSSQPSQSQPKKWELIGSYSGSGSGSQSISVPAGEIMIKISAYPIKNYATNHLYVSGSNGQSVGVDWGSTSAVETRSDSITYTSSSPQTFTIDYYETVSWQVEFYRYQ